MKTTFKRSVLLLFGIFCLALHANADTLSLTTGNNATTTPNVATSITGFQVVGNAASTTPIQLRVTNGSLSMTTTTGLTFDGPSSGSQINFSGTLANINAALATLKYTRSGTGTDTLEVSLVTRGEVFFLTNNHLYKFVAGSYTWSQAQTAAALSTAYGASGYLATITSLAENNFVYTRITGDGWLGTTDTDTEKTWKWMTGPETGIAYFQENPSGGGGSPISGRYNGWASGEPNDFGSGEDCGYMYASQNGEWNDYPCSTPQGYVAEFGAPGNLPTVVAANISIVTADVPAVTALSPANGAINVSTDTNFSITFSKTVTKNSGDIVLRRTSDDSIFETIAVSSSNVTGSGGSTITINPINTLEENTQYYVLIPNTAFRDASSNYFDGIDASSTWVFTTGDFTAPTISNATSSVATSSATLTWETNENASSRIVFGSTEAYGSTTPTLNLSPRITSHSITLSGLVPCATYYYKMISEDAVLNTSTSTEKSFMTTGCIGSSAPLSASSTSINVNSTGTSTLTKDTSSLTVTTPSNFTATSSTVVIQIQTLDKIPVLETIGKPETSLQSISNIVFDVKAIINSQTVLDSFDAPITITYSYSDSDIAGINESTLWLYHYHANSWQPLTDCTVTQDTNTIRCTTQSFSIFSLFGKNSEITIGHAPIIYGCADKLAINFSMYITHKNELCIYATSSPTITELSISKEIIKEKAEQPSLIFNISNLPKHFQFLKNIRSGSIHKDALMLQKFLNANGFTVATTGEGSPGNETTYFGTKTKMALIKFQEAYAEDILTPQGLLAGTGNLWNFSRKVINGWIKEQN